jgi:peptidoglycan/LPS O-acetylase OafA/YrhL
VTAFVVPYVGSGMGVAILTVVAFAVSLPVAWVSYDMLETRFGRVLRGLISPAPVPVALPATVVGSVTPVTAAGSPPELPSGNGAG